MGGPRRDKNRGRANGETAGSLSSQAGSESVVALTVGRQAVEPVGAASAQREAWKGS